MVERRRRLHAVGHEALVSGVHVARVEDEHGALRLWRLLAGPPFGRMDREVDAADLASVVQRHSLVSLILDGEAKGLP